MKFPKISALVPEKEHFDETAVNEGVWLSEPHLSQIENALSNAEVAAGEAATNLQTANASIEAKNNSLIALTEEVASQKKIVENLTAEKAASEKKMTDQAAENDIVLAAKDKEIASLQEEVARLGKNASGTGSTVVTKEDENADESAGEMPSLLDPNHPLNQYATAKLTSAKKPKL